MGIVIDSLNYQKLGREDYYMAEEVGVLGLISDTRGLLRKEAVRALEGSDFIRVWLL